MLLIGSDMFKALWYWIPPIAILARGEPISHGFCQAAGFLLAMGVEASGPLHRINSYHLLLKLKNQTPLYSSLQSIPLLQSLHRVRQTPRLACTAIDREPTLVGRPSQYSWRHWPLSIQAILSTYLLEMIFHMWSKLRHKTSWWSRLTFTTLDTCHNTHICTMKKGY